jgi:hypothetical protein
MQSSCVSRAHGLLRSTIHYTAFILNNLTYTPFLRPINADAEQAKFAALNHHLSSETLGNGAMHTASEAQEVLSADRHS